VTDICLQEERWLTLGQAAERLSVHRATLRRWADNGAIPVLLTPGGHRRFATSDGMCFAGRRQLLRQSEAIGGLSADQALAKMRHEVVSHAGEHWLVGLDDDVRERNRKLGQRLLGLTLQYLANEDGAGLLEEARKVGREYGHLALLAGLPLRDALGASIFFRDTLVETAMQLPENMPVRPEANARLLRRINTLLNAVHLAMAEVFDATYSVALSGA
jgi:excisionase family DNA binding protein